MTKLNSAGSALVYSTFLGGNASGSGIAVDAGGNVYVAGQAGPGFPLLNPIPNPSGGGLEAFVVKLNAPGSALAYSTFLGGSDRDEASGVTIDTAGNAYVIGTTESTNFLTKDPVQPNNAGFRDAFVAKISGDAGCSPTLSADSAAPEQAADTLTLTNVMPPGSDLVSGASLKLGGLKATVTWLLQSQDDATLVVRLFDQNGDIRGDAGSLTVKKPATCPHKMS